MNIREIISYVNQYDKDDYDDISDYLDKIHVEVQNFCEERLKTFKQKIIENLCFIYNINIF